MYLFILFCQREKSRKLVIVAFSFIFLMCYALYSNRWLYSSDKYLSIRLIGGINDIFNWSDKLLRVASPRIDDAPLPGLDLFYSHCYLQLKSSTNEFVLRFPPVKCKKISSLILCARNNFSSDGRPLHYSIILSYRIYYVIARIHIFVSLSFSLSVLFFS